MCAARDWDGMEELAEACMDAVDRGKQLWPITAHIDYRLALEAPGDHAAEVLESDLGRFLPGPLTEVAASTHTWEQLAPFIESPQSAAYVAQERVLRGEDLTGDDRAHPEIVDLPLRLEDFEPTYALATFSAHDVEIAEPWEPKGKSAPVTGTSAEPVRAAGVTEVLLDIVAPWTNESNGAARAVLVEGDAQTAILTLTEGIPEPVDHTPLEPEEALQRIAWAAASGGAHGRRRGAAFGRFTAWSVVAALAGEPWPVSPKDVADIVAGLDWFAWDDRELKEGWVFRIAVQDARAGWAAAIGATDLLEEEPES